MVGNGRMGGLGARITQGNPKRIQELFSKCRPFFSNWEFLFHTDFSQPVSHLTHSVASELP